MARCCENGKMFIHLRHDRQRAEKTPCQTVCSRPGFPQPGTRQNHLVWENCTPQRAEQKLCLEEISWLDSSNWCWKHRLGSWKYCLFERNWKGFFFSFTGDQSSPFSHSICKMKDIILKIKWNRFYCLPTLSMEFSQQSKYQSIPTGKKTSKRAQGLWEIWKNFSFRTSWSMLSAFLCPACLVWG